MSDSLGDIQRGIEGHRVRHRHPHLMKGIHRGRRPGHRRLLDPSAARRGRRYHPVQLPGDDPAVEAGPALACGNAFILKPSERDPSVPLRLAELFLEAGLPPGVFRVVQGDKGPSTPSPPRPDIKAVGFVGAAPISRSIYSGRGRTPQTGTVFGGAKEPHDRHARLDLDRAVDALIGAGYSSAGERCMAISVAVAVGDGPPTGCAPGSRAGPSTSGRAQPGPQGRLRTALVTEAALDRVRGYIDAGVAGAPTSSWTAAKGQ